LGSVAAGEPFIADPYPTIGLRRWALGAISLWETNSAEEQRDSTRSCLRDADGVIVTCDLTDSTSFEALDSWLEFVRGSSPVKYQVIIGTKADLVDDR
jgi:GTPase SAR1 family protein